MIKTLFLVSIITFISLGFFYISKYDIQVEILAGQYLVETSAFFLTMQFLIIILLLSFIVFALKKILSYPSYLYQKYLDSKNKTEISSIIQAANYAILGDNAQAIKIGKQFLDSNNQEYKNFGITLMTLSPSIGDQIHYLHELSTTHKSFLINKKLMLAFIKEKNYHQAAFYGYAAFIENEHDKDLYPPLIISYCKILNGEKTIFFLEKAERNYPEIVKLHLEEIESAMLESAIEFSKSNISSSILLLKKLTSGIFQNEQAKQLLLKLSEKQ